MRCLLLIELIHAFRPHRPCYLLGCISPHTTTHLSIRCWLKQKKTRKSGHHRQSSNSVLSTTYKLLLSTITPFDFYLFRCECKLMVRFQELKKMLGRQGTQCQYLDDVCTNRPYRALQFDLPSLIAKYLLITFKLHSEIVIIQKHLSIDVQCKHRIDIQKH